MSVKATSDGSQPLIAVNLKLCLDGSGDYWVMPVTVGDKPQRYYWMPYRLGQAARAEELAKKSAE
jgi:hypothetical protein